MNDFDDLLSSFVASVGVPALHTLLPGSPAAWPEGSPRTPEARQDDALDADNLGEPEVRKPVRTRIMRERDVLERTARHCLDEIAALYVLRAPEHDKPWSHAADTELRLLRALDAFAALAGRSGSSRVDLVRVVLSHAIDAPTLDEARLFTRAFVLGSFRGSQPVGEAVLATRGAPFEARDAERLGYCLASGREVEAALRPLLRDDDPSLVRLALGALAFRRETDAEATLPLLAHPDPGVAVAAAVALANVDPSAEVKTALDALLTGEGDDAVALAAAESLRCHGALDGIDFVRRRLIDDHEAIGVLTAPMQLQYLRLIALAGTPSDSEILVEGVRGRARAVSLLGWHGSPDLVMPLLGILETGNRFRRGSGPFPWKLELAAAEALHRITGAPLRQSAQADEMGEDQLVSRLGDPSELPGEEDNIAEMNELVAAAGTLEIEAERWAGWWADHRHEFVSARRYRFGRPHSRGALVAELLAADTLPRHRRLAARELAFLGATRLETDDWIVRQRAELMACVEP